MSETKKDIGKMQNERAAMLILMGKKKRVGTADLGHANVVLFSRPVPVNSVFDDASPWWWNLSWFAKYKP